MGRVDGTLYLKYECLVPKLEFPLLTVGDPWRYHVWSREVVRYLAQR